MKITAVITKNTVTPFLNKLPNNLDKAINQTLYDWADFTQGRAQYYSSEISGAYSQGAVSLKLMSSIKKAVGKKTASVYQDAKMTTKSTQSGKRYNYGALQEKGVGAESFVGWKPVYAKGRWYMMPARHAQLYHPGFKGKRFMQRAARDGRAYAVRSLSDNIKVALRR